MTTENVGELAEAVLARANAIGFAVSESQLRRWHLDGLLPRPKQLWVAGIAGSQTVYPVGTGNQLCALCAIRDSNRSSTMNWGWTLWWLGFPVDEKFWRRKLAAQATLIAKSTTEFVRVLDSDQPDERYADVVTAFHSRRTQNVSFRQLRRRVGKQFEGMVGLIHSILAGAFRGWSFSSSNDEDSLRYRNMIQKVFGFRRTKNDREMIENPAIHDDVEVALQLLSDQLGEVKITKVLATSSAKTIAETRTQLRVILFTASGSDEGSTELAGLGMDVLKKMALRASSADQAAFLLYLLALKRNPKFEKELAVFLLALRRFIPKTISQTQIDDFRSRDPAICSFAFPN